MKQNRRLRFLVGLGVLVLVASRALWLQQIHFNLIDVVLLLLLSVLHRKAKQYVRHQIMIAQVLLADAEQGQQQEYEAGQVVVLNDTSIQHRQATQMLHRYELADTLLEAARKGLLAGLLALIIGALLQLALKLILNALL